MRIVIFIILFNVFQGWAQDYRFPYFSNGYWGFLNFEGTKVIRNDFLKIGRFSNGLAPVQFKDSLWGYIDTNGIIKIAPFYIHASEFSEGLAVVRTIERKYGYIDTAGIFVHPAIFYSAYNFRYGVAAVSNNTFINREGKKIIFKPAIKECECPPLYFSDSLLMNNRSGKRCIYYSPDGKRRIKVKKGCGNFYNNFAVIERNGNYGFINKKGETIFQPKFQYALPFTEGIAAVKQDSLWGFIDINGVFIIKPIFQNVYYGFSEGLCLVKINNNWCFIDRSGTQVILGNFSPLIINPQPGIFKGHFENGVCCVIMDGKPTYLNKNGKTIFHFKD